MKTFVLLAAILLSPLTVSAMEPERVFLPTLPVPMGVQAPTDPSIPEIGWYRWTTKNFTIHSYDKSQGQYLFENIEQMKTWCFERWGLPDPNFFASCQVFCAPDDATMKKLFNMTGSFGESRNINGKMVNLLWLTLSAKPMETIPPALSIVCLQEFDGQQGRTITSGNKIGFWIHRGVPALNMTVPQIRRYIVDVGPLLQQEGKVYFSQALLKMTEEDWKKLTPEQKIIFDKESAILCLFVRKEFGQNNFHKMMAGPQGVTTVLGFRDFDHLDSSLKRYMFYLTADIQQNKTPDHYLQIEAVK